MAANKTISKPEQQDPFGSSALQSQLARIKKEEEEEVWISGEELHTEGSSDEDEAENEARLRRKLNDNHLIHTSANQKSEPGCCSPICNETKAKSDNPAGSQKQQRNKKQISRLTPNSIKTPSTEVVEPQLIPPPPTPTGFDLNDHAEENSDFYPLNEEECDETNGISWKANRGTIVLPNCSNNISDQSEKC